MARWPGIVVGLEAEARIARQFFPDVAVAGGRPDLAARAAAELVARGVSGLISFGICGGLDPELRSGDLVIGTKAGDIAATLFVEAELPRGAVASPDAFVLTAAEKAALYQTGAIIVDMESQAVARAAQEAGLPFGILRAVADDAHQDLPKAVTRALDEVGRRRILPVLAGLLAAPQSLPELLAAKRSTEAALDALFRRGGALLLSLA